MAFNKELLNAYQKMVYNAVIIPNTSNEPAAKPGDILNIEASTSKPFGLTPLLFSILVMMLIPITQKINTNPIRSRNGISYTPSAFNLAKLIGSRNDRSANCGNTFK